MKYLDHVKEKIYMLRGLQELLNAGQRLEIWDTLQAGYCQHCGEKTEIGVSCKCVNDE